MLQPTMFLSEVFVLLCVLSMSAIAHVHTHLHPHFSFSLGTMHWASGLSKPVARWAWGN